MKNFKTKAILAILLASAVFFEGCYVQLPSKYDFKRMFTPYLSRIDDNPVIIIPGIIGSRLVNSKTGKTLWGALRVEQIFLLSERDDIALPVDKESLAQNRDDIVSTGIIDKYDLPIEIIQFTVYRELLDMLEKVGYKLGDIKNPKPGDNLYIFDYDWRRDNVETAKVLAERIEHIKKTTNKPHERFNLLCHSMGGLIGRYYMRYGGSEVLDQSPNFKVTYAGAKNIKRLMLIGVPNLGSMPIFEFLHRGLDLKIVNYQPYILFTMPSIYQLLPFKGVKSFVDENGDDMDVNLYDAENWKKYGWSIYSEKMATYLKWRYKLKYKDVWEKRFEEFEADRDRFVKAALERAELFQNSLRFRTEKEPPCETIIFGGDTEWTLKKAILKKDKKGSWRTSFWDPRLAKKILMPGDTMITRESLLGVTDAGLTTKGWLTSPMHISFALFVTQRHENIHKDATFQGNLLHILLGN